VVGELNVGEEKTVPAENVADEDVAKEKIVEAAETSEVAAEAEAEPAKETVEAAQAVPVPADGENKAEL
jgi:hypothetical protein